jgi:hypothetical protein
MTTYPPTPFPRKGVTLVQPLCGFHNLVLMPPCPNGISFGQGGPAEAS